MAELYLNAKVFFCITEGKGVFLDLVQDAYTAVSLSSCGDVTHEIAEAKADEAFAPHCEELVAEGLLANVPSGGARFADYLSIIRPQNNIFHLRDDRAFGAGTAERGARVGVGDIVDFVSASHRASKALRRQHISSTVEQVRVRKAAAGDAVADLELVRQETAIFRKLRPWYPRAYLCLYDALALVEFLAGRNLFPTWVFGVQVQPFGAHCWLQVGACVLNERVEYAKQFTPIMAV